MDATTQRLADYVAGLGFSTLTPAAVHETKRRLIDSIACAVGGYPSEPVRIARRLAAGISGTPGARLLFSGERTSMERAAFANAVMIRYLDCNDTYVSVGSGHPSDMIPAVLAAGDALGASGRDVLAAVAAAYEIYVGLADVVPLRPRGWDQGVFAVLGSAAGAGRLLGLNRDQLANALSIAVSANVPTRQARAGELAMWKGCATAASAQAGVFAALLAKEGMTGPTAAFEGKHGIWEQVTGEFRVGALGGGGTPFGIERTNLKYFPAEYHSQAPLAMAIALRAKAPVEAVEAIDVETYHMTWSEIGSEPEKWDPRTRETADHSLPYLLASAWRDGAITVATFTDERIRDPALRPFMNRIKVRENPGFTSQFPGAMVSEITVTTKDGQRFVERASYPRGHARNPLSDDDVAGKFGDLCAGLLPEEQQRRCLDLLRGLDEAPSIRPLFEIVRVEEKR